MAEVGTKRCVAGIFATAVSSVMIYGLSSYVSQSSFAKTDIDFSPDTLTSIKATVLHCNDGDTCRLKVAESLWMNVRLAGIDAPETSKNRGKTKGQPLGDAARDFLNETVKGKEVIVKQIDLDPFNRPVVELTIGDKLVNLQMIEKGFAEVYRGKKKRIDKSVYLDAEQKSREQKVGIWGQDSYQSPKDFRSQNK
jgi:endonuclease YncB( thermonuclease family)